MKLKLLEGKEHPLDPVGHTVKVQSPVFSCQLEHQLVEDLGQIQEIPAGSVFPFLK